MRDGDRSCHCGGVHCPLSSLARRRVCPPWLWNGLLELAVDVHAEKVTLDGEAGHGRPGGRGVNARAIVALFHKMPGRRLELFSLTVITPCTLFGGKPGIQRDIYDVELSRKYGYLFDKSGSGGGNSPVPVEGIYYACGDVRIKEHPCRLVDPKDKPPWRGKRTRLIRRLNKTRRLRAIPWSLDGAVDLLDWLEEHGIEQDSVWCSECDDVVPGDELCDHCWWCDKIGWYSTPSERCGCASRRICDA